jgi:hypothetical protein
MQQSSTFKKFLFQSYLSIYSLMIPNSSKLFGDAAFNNFIIKLIHDANKVQPIKKICFQAVHQ